MLDRYRCVWEIISNDFHPQIGEQDARERETEALSVSSCMSEGSGSVDGENWWEED